MAGRSARPKLELLTGSWAEVLDHATALRRWKDPLRGPRRLLNRLSVRGGGRRRVGSQAPHWIPPLDVSAGIPRDWAARPSKSAVESVALKARTISAAGTAAIDLIRGDLCARLGAVTPKVLRLPF